MIPFYPYFNGSNTLWAIDVYDAYPSNTCAMIEAGDVITIINVTSNTTVAVAEYYNYSDASGNPYSSLNSLKEATASFFVKATDAIVAQMNTLSAASPNRRLDYLNPTSSFVTFKKTTSAAPLITTTLAYDTATATAFEIFEDVTIKNLTYVVPSSSTVGIPIQIGIYEAGTNDSNTSWLGKLVWSGIAAATGSTVVTQTITFDLFLKKGIYFFALAANGHILLTTQMALIPDCDPISANWSSTSIIYPVYMVTFPYRGQPFVDNQPSNLATTTNMGYAHALMFGK